MNVGELIAYLRDYPSETEIVLQKDAEGNGYSPLEGADTGIYIAASTYSGDFYDLGWTASDCCMEDDEHAELMAKPRSIVLYPIN